MKQINRSSEKLSISVFVAFTINCFILVWLSTNPFPEENVNHLLFGIFFVVWVAIALGFSYFLFLNRVREVNALDRLESINEGAIEEKQAYRQLAEDEIVLLEHYAEGAHIPEYYQDSRSPVFRLQGKLVKSEGERKDGGKFFDWPFHFIVRGLKITTKNYHDLKKVAHEFKDGDEVAVEFSPHTKHVWKIYKVEDLK